ncbi:MAG: endonuclease [Alphaproteobacteria bacterium CG_4_10_14_0_2_um_filter_63_37]|nr:MAG: endonuclease [Proteobacteria bacterium CG1_02_64_396]PJA26061.1 MAG: endonuclease [Alphaproteobacteria bacterium CG_4_10_14_0_2_um_filter_63_37]
MPDKTKKKNKYESVILGIFSKYHRAGATEFEFSRDDFEEIGRPLGLWPIKNIGDVVYSFRYRNELPDEIRRTATEGKEWIIVGAGHARYRFKQVRLNRILPREELMAVKVPDATPEIISAYALSDEQALLAKVRYNRLVDVFLGIAAFSLQNHLRTTVKEVGQIEIDEIYVGIDRSGRQFVVPVQAKGGNDKHGVVQTQQDILCCNEKFPHLVCRAVSAQFMTEDRIAMFELTVDDDEIKIVDERHYRLVPANEITAEDLRRYSMRTS